MKAYSLFAVLLICCFQLPAQKMDKKKEDKAAIKSMCGCYSIDFDYAETFPMDTSYQLRAPYQPEASAEWVFVEEESEDKIVIQHLLIVGENTIIKHWRQDWTYENNEFYHFDGDLNWKYTKVPASKVKGQWTQLVTQVDDSPRYVGSATWLHVDGKHWWESTADAPLPRREYSKRNDYNVMQRTNRHEIMEDGWLHGQDNLKIVRKDGKDEVLVSEKGRNYYTKIKNNNCKAAQKWWKENKDFWKLVRNEWDEIYSQKQHLHLHKKVNDSLMWETMFELGDELAEEARKSPEEVRIRIHDSLSRFLADMQTAESPNY